MMAHISAQRECICHPTINRQCYFFGIPAVAIPVTISSIFVIWRIALLLLNRTFVDPSHGSTHIPTHGPRSDNLPNDEKSIGVITTSDATIPKSIEAATEEHNIDCKDDVSRLENLGSYGLHMIHALFTVPVLLDIRMDSLSEQNPSTHRSTIFGQTSSRLIPFCALQVAGLLAAVLMDKRTRLAILKTEMISWADLQNVSYKTISSRHFTLCAAWLMLAYNVLGAGVLIGQALPVTTTIRVVAIFASILGSLSSPSAQWGETTVRKDSLARRSLNSRLETGDFFSAASLITLVARDCLPEGFGVYHYADSSISIWSICLTFILMWMRESLQIFHEGLERFRGYGLDFVNGLSGLVITGVIEGATEFGRIGICLSIFAVCFIMSSWTVSCLPFRTLLFGLPCSDPSLRCLHLGGFTSILISGVLDWKDTTQSRPPQLAKQFRVLSLRCSDAFAWTVVSMTGTAALFWVCKAYDGIPLALRLYRLIVA